MAKCKLCKTDIPDGAEYCKDCLDKERLKANESYLDSLLNSVKNTVPSTDSIYKKKSDASVKAVQNTRIDNSITDDQDEAIYDFDMSDIEDFSNFNYGEDITDLNTEEIITDEDLFGVNVSNTSSRSVAEGASHDNSEDMKKHDTEEDTVSEYNDLIREMNASDDNGEDEDGLETDLDKLINQLDNVPEADVIPNNESEIPIEAKRDKDLKNISDSETSFPKDNSKDNTKDIPQDNSKDIPQDNFKDIPQDNYEENSEDDAETEEDFLSLLNQISSDDPVSDDIKAITDLMKGVPENSHQGLGMPSDVGEVFSDALKAVSNLNDSDIAEKELLSSIPDKKAAKAKKGKKKSKKSREKKKVSEGRDKPAISIWQRLFGNVEDKKASKGSKASAIGQTDKDIVEVPQKGEKKKGKKGKVKEEETQESGSRNKQAKDNQDDAEDKNGKSNKKEKKEKKKKKQKSADVIQVIDEIDEDLGRINRLGATIVFVFFGLLALLIYAGSNAVSYTLSIQHATSYFSNQKYTEAYDEVYGINIEDDDKEIYSKIMTVMFVNKQLNSYNNYCTIGEYPQALDSLLKGLRRYDKYIKLATMLGIKTDMNYVRDQIIAELKNKFKLSEEDALKMININDMKEYSVKVYNVALENE